MNMNPASKFAALSLLLLASCSKTPEQAREKLAEMQIPATAETLLAKTKTSDGAEAAKLIVESGIDPNARQANGMTALMSAVFNKQHDVAEKLLEKGADPGLEAAGFNALAMAVEAGDEDMVRLLLKYGADPNRRPGGGLSALEQARKRDNQALIGLLGGESK